MQNRFKKLNIADIFTRSAALYRENFQTLAGITFIPLIPITILKLIFFVFPSLYVITLGFPPFYLLIELLFMGIFAETTLIIAVAKIYHGEPTSILGAYQKSWRRYGAVLVATLLIALIGGGGTLILSGLIPCGSIIPILFVIYCSARLVVINATIVLEKINGIQAISRSWKLTLDYFWHSLGILIISLLLRYVIGGVFQFLGMFLAGPFSMVGIVIGRVIPQIALLITIPLSVCLITVFYYDLRIRTERYDLELRAGQELQDNAEIENRS